MKDFLHHLFLPRQSNNHKAKLLHHKSLVMILVSLLFLEGIFIATEKKYEGVLGISSSITVQELIDQTNKQRADNNLPPLTLSDQLASAATAKASDMFTKDYWAHIAPDGATPWGFIRGAGYEYLYAGENLARGFTTTTDVMNAWMASPGHKENILSPNYKEVGFAIQTGTLTGDETVLVVEEFGSRMNSDTAKEVTAVATEPTITPTVAPSSQPKLIARTVTATPTLFPTATPTIIIPKQPVVVTPVPQRTLIAGVQSSPLIDEPSLKKYIVLGIVGILLLTFIVDLIFVEKRSIVRMFSHHLDHIIYFAIILAAILIIGRGVII